MHTLKKRIELERKVVRNLIRTAKNHGFELRAVDNGEERIKLSTETEAMDHVFSVDESKIIFKHPTQMKSHVACIVLGNDGWDAISDSSEGELWDAVMQASYDYCETLSS